MPHNRRSLLVTDAYRRRIASLGQRVEEVARRRWPTIEALDSTPWPEQMAALVAQAQLTGARAAAGYLAAFYRSETGQRINPPNVPLKTVGQSRDGRPLIDALQSPLIGVRAALKEGKPPREALRLGLQRATRMTGFEAVQMPREALLQAIDESDLFSGWQRSTSGTCGACLALSADGGPQFEVHPNCECQPAPTISDLRDRFPIPTGAALFKSKTPEEQDAALGPETAERVRAGEVAITDLVSHSKLESDQPDFVTQKPLDAVS